MEVDVQIQGVAEALHEGDGAALRLRATPRCLRARRRSEAKTARTKRSSTALVSGAS